MYICHRNVRKIKIKFEPLSLDLSIYLVKLNTKTYLKIVSKMYDETQNFKCFGEFLVSMRSKTDYCENWSLLFLKF